jgi:hypothetical protein
MGSACQPNGGSARAAARRSLHVRQAQVEKDRVKGLGLSETVASFPVRGMVHRESCAFQAIGQSMGEIRIIFDQKDTDGGLPCGPILCIRLAALNSGRRRTFECQPTFRLASAHCQFVMG